MHLISTRTELDPFLTREKKEAPRGNGGWGDIRDRTLCLSMDKDKVEAGLLLARENIDQIKEAEGKSQLLL